MIAIDGFAGIAGVRAIQSRIAAVAGPPARISEIQRRFATQLAAATTVDAPAAASTNDQPASTGDVQATAPSAFGAASSLDAPPSAAATAGAWRSAPVLGEARILRVGAPSGLTTASVGSGSASLGTPGGAIPAVTPRGGWVDRVPIQRGKDLAPYIQGVADRYGLDPALLAAVFWTESGYQANAVSSAGAVGLGQLMPGTAATLGVDPYDPMQNMDGSARLYRYLIDKYGGSLELAISAYACGEGAVARAGGVPSEFARKYIATLLGRRDYLAGTRPTPP